MRSAYYKSADDARSPGASDLPAIFERKENKMSMLSKVRLIIVLFFACCLCACYTSTQQEKDRPAGYQPNPFSPGANISISLEEKQLVTITMYDLSGNRIAVFFQDTLEAGPHVYTVMPDTSLPSGEYLIQCQTQDSTYQQKYIHVK
jgi:hypothetical protein